MLRIAHIVNPFLSPSVDSWDLLQGLTLKSLSAARSYALAHGLIVDLYAIQSAGQHCEIPNDWNILPEIQRTILDLYNLNPRLEFPLLSDILMPLYEHSQADFFVYSNADICLMPSFYTFVQATVNQGFDAFCINRRTIRNFDITKLDYYSLCSEIGEKHPGFDCFVFSRKLFSEFVLEDVCLGANLSGRALIFNLIYSSKQFKIFEDLHLTFHLGDDQNWRGLSEFNQHNYMQVCKILEKLRIRNPGLKHPLIESFLKSKINNWLG